jgi:hypothetical protein
MIGYPGVDHVITGGRGVLRARLQVHAVAGHSGSRQGGAGAIAKAADLIRTLRDAPLPGPAGPGFPLRGQAHHHRHQRRTGVLGDPGPVHGQRGHPADPGARWSGRCRAAARRGRERRCGLAGDSTYGHRGDNQMAAVRAARWLAAV